MPFNQDLTVDEEPPSYDSLTPSQKDLSKKNELLQEEIDYWKKRYEVLVKTHDHDKQTNRLLETQIKLLEQQLHLTKHVEEQFAAQLVTVTEKQALLQRKNDSLFGWVESSIKEEENALIYIETLEMSILSLKDFPEIANLRSNVQELERNFSRAKEEDSLETEAHVNARNKSLEENILSLVNRSAFTQIVSQLEIKFAAIIQREQALFLIEFREKKLSTDPLLQQYLDDKTQKLIALKQIQENEKLVVFYNTAYIVLWSKITGFLAAFSQLVEKKAGFGEKAVDVTASVVGGFLGSVPIVGPLLDTIAALTIKEVGGGLLDKTQNKKNITMLDILQNPDYAKKMSELFARTLTLRAQADIQSWDIATIKDTATKNSNQVYELSIGGKIKECISEPPEKIVDSFLESMKKGMKLNLLPTSPKSRHADEKSASETQTLVQTQEILSQTHKTEFLAQHTAINLKGLKRQSSGLVEASNKNAEQVAALQLEVNSLKSQVYDMQQTIERLLKAPQPSSQETAKKTKVKESFFKRT